MYNYIVIEGNIGVGKTSLATRLAAERNASLILEQFEENSFLPKFYGDPSRYAFPLELSFLADRYQQLKEHFGRPDLFKPVTIADYLIYKSLIFAGQTLEPSEMTLYNRLFSIMASVVPKPDLLVFLFLKPEKLKHNIVQRGRSYELNISIEYLEKIQQGYLEFMKRQPDWRILLIETSRVDFVNYDEDYHWITDLIFKDYPPGITRVKR